MQLITYMNSLILVVDDMDINRIILAEILSTDYDIVEASNGNEALKVLAESPRLPDVILLDIMMPGMDGYETIKRIKADQKTKEIPVLFITAADIETNETKALSEGAIDFISKPFNSEVVKVRVDNHIQLCNYRKHLEQMVDEKTQELNLLHRRILDTLATIIEYRSLESGMHIRRTTELTKVLLERMLDTTLFKEQILSLNYQSIVKAVALHDIGKVGIPDNILLKPGKLTDEEFEIMKEHTVIGANIVDTISKDIKDDNTMYLKHCKDICLYHHERWDGKGYMNHLEGTNIPLSARVVSVVDVYDALTSDRCYKPAFSHEKAVEIILEGKGTQFDPDIVDCFLQVSDVFEKLSIELKDEESVDCDES